MAKNNSIAELKSEVARLQAENEKLKDGAGMRSEFERVSVELAAAQNLANDRAVEIGNLEKRLEAAEQKAQKIAAETETYRVI